jgi:hypothetical protein
MASVHDTQPKAEYTNATATSTLLKSFIHRLQEESIYDLLGAVLTDMPLPKYHNSGIYW